MSSLMNKAEVTPRPWVVGTSYDWQSRWPVFRLRDMTTASGDEAFNDALFIELAVNSHDALVEALEMAIVEHALHCEHPWTPETAFAITEALALARGEDQP